jgi:nucleotide-binding universal stress UspA family protein
MKSVLLYANGDPQLEPRLQASLAVARLFEGHLTCLQVTPYESFIMGDPFGGVYALPSVVAHVAKVEAEHEAKIEERLRRESLSWSWKQVDGPPEYAIPSEARLEDLIVVSLPDAATPHHLRTLAIAAEAALTARAPVLGIPGTAGVFAPGGAALVAWNGSMEAAHALRLALPMLARASSVTVVGVREDSRELRFGLSDAFEYLSRHAVTPDVREMEAGGRCVPDLLLEAAAGLGAAYIVLGAYGHSRLREAVLGGTTRALIRESRIPLLLAH